MACSFPVKAYQCLDGSVVFRESTRFNTVRTLFLPCGQCTRCRLERSRQWAIRCVHEASLYESNCFVTLTYSEEHLKSSSLRYRDFQLFMKRLRQRIRLSTEQVRKSDTCSGGPSMMRSTEIRFYMCGEYGENFGRPHFHACLFNCDFPDKLYFKKAGDSKVYTSKILEELWPFGNSLIGSVTFESAAYVARYCMAKVTGPEAEGWYTDVDASTGEIVERVPEFNRMSLKPGIGMPWLRKYWNDVYPRGDVVVRGKRVKPPKAYDRLLQRFSDDDWAQLSLKREHAARLSFGDNTEDRLAVKEQVAIARLAHFKRSL